VVRRHSQRGFSLIEITVAMFVFSAFLAILFVLTSEMRKHEREMPLNFMTHPQIASVVARVRRDVLDAHGRSPYLNEFEGYAASPKVLILQTIQKDGLHTVVWDFGQPGEVTRYDWKVGRMTKWTARGVPSDFAALQIGPVKTGSDAAWATRIVAKDSGGKIAIDQILQPRATE
jgi:prepilin-type N-terminal cleavage/methylation domain-containing protein